MSIDKDRAPERKPAPPQAARAGTPRTGGEARNLVGVRLGPYGRTLDMDAGDLRLDAHEQVVIDDRRGGPMVATTCTPSGRRAARGPVGRVLRRAEPRDLARLEDENRRNVDALAFARERSRARQLAIKFFRVEFAANGDKTTFYFSSEQRVDFRELVRELAARFHNRIELRQVGVRDEAKMVGGIGSCGQELCCSTFLPSFAPVTIKMAKNQNLALNPARVSGQCGRLKCCLVYEEAQYIEAGKLLPKLGKRVETPDGPGRVDDLDVLRGRIRVSFPDRPPVTYGAADVRAAAGGGPGDSRPDIRVDARPDARPERTETRAETPPDDEAAPPVSPTPSDEPKN
jgi:cell fate regulator YaaT (PSP1 superfamily)